MNSIDGNRLDYYELEPNDMRLTRRDKSSIYY